MSGTAGTLPIVIADDLTGALDTGVRFRILGSEVRVLSRFIFPGDLTLRLKDETPRIWVVNTRTRHDPPAAAAARVGSVAAAIKDACIDRIYKKCDSTLRGNLGAELAALASAFPERAILLVPAFPDLGRTTRKGMHYVDGIPLAESSFGKDALNPLRTSSIPELIGEQCGLPVVVLSAVGFAADPEGALKPGTIVVPDAETENDMRIIADALGVYRGASVRAEADGAESSALGSAPFPILAGSAGLAAYIPAIYGRQGSDLPGMGRSGGAGPSGNAGPMLVVVGSRHEVSRTQARCALAQGFYEIIVPRETGDGVASRSDGAGFTAPGVAAAADRAAAALDAGKDCLIHEPRKSDSGQVKRIMAALVENLMRRAKIGNLVVFGGDTLEAVLDALGADVLEPLGEFAPGIVRCAAHRRGNLETTGDRLNLVTKAGGFGGNDLLLALKAAQEQER